MKDDRTILPHVGVGALRFGMNRGEVRELLGEPTLADAESVPDWESWAYPSLGLELTFDADEAFRCTYMQVDHADYLVSGRVVLGLSRAALEETALDLALGECILSEDDWDADVDSDVDADERADDQADDHGDEETLEFPDADVEIHLEAGRSVTLGWSAEIDESDEFRFPDRA
jgi:hypothetical protein